MRIRFYGGRGLNKNIKKNILNREYDLNQLMSIYKSFDIGKSGTMSSFIFDVIIFLILFLYITYQMSNGFKHDVGSALLYNFIFCGICVGVCYYTLFVLEKRQFLKAIKKSYPELLDDIKYNILENQKTLNDKKELYINDKLAIDIAIQLNELYEILLKENTDVTKKNRKYLLLRIKDQNIAKNCSVDNIQLFKKRINERSTIIGYELMTGWIISGQDENELESKIVVKIDNNDSVKIDCNNEMNIQQIDESLKEMESLIKNKYNKQIETNYITRNQSNTIIELKNNDFIQINLFNKKKRVQVFSTGDNKFDENGNDKVDNFKLSDEEINCLNWFIENVNIEDYKEEILKYCNNEYSMWSDIKITEHDIENEINIVAIAINITKNWKSNDGFVYPEISFYGNCKCDEEHGICIGFRDKKFLGIHSQDWTL